MNIGNRTKDTFVPAELCEIEPGQPFNDKLNEYETAEMIKHACNPPPVNAAAITQQGLGLLGLRDGEGPMEGFGVTVSVDMAVVPARILTPPKVVYKSGEPRVADGSWNILGVRFHNAKPLRGVAVLVIADGGRDDFRSPQDLKPVVEGFLAKCAASGMAVDPGLPPVRFAPTPLSPATQRDPFRLAAIEQLETAIKSFPARPALVLVFMSSRDPHLYPGLKGLCDVKLGISTVCMLMPKVRKERGQDQYFSNIALKVNTKLGGVNHQLDAPSMRWLKGTMLVGMDVTHPGPGLVNGTPSIAAVVASCDEGFMQYPASLRMHESRKEVSTLNISPE